MSLDPTKSIEVKHLIDSFDEAISQYILQDVPRWEEIVKSSKGVAFEYYWRTRQEFRSLIRFRMTKAEKKFSLESSITNKLTRLVGSHSWLYVSNLFISCDEIGPGFYIEHGFSTVIYAKEIGKNFWVNQNVTIGSGKGGCPVIGDDVSVSAHGLVFGGINVASGVTVGAGAILNFEVPEGSTVVMQKSRVILK